MFATVVLVACEPRPSKSTGLTSDGKIRVMVSVAPQAELVRRIGGDNVFVQVLVGEGQDPHVFSPSPSTMKDLGSARLLLTVGMPFEENLIKKIVSSNSSIITVDTSEGIKKLALDDEHDGHTEHGENEEHHHVDDPHIWLAPNALKVQIQNILNALQKEAPQHSEEFTANYASLSQDIDALQKELTKKMQPFSGKKIFVFHPAFGYFAQAYGLEQISVEVGGNSPTPKELSEFMKMAKSEKIKLLFVQPQFDARSARIIAEQLEAKVYTMDPLDSDILSNLRNIASAIAESLSG